MAITDLNMRVCYPGSRDDLLPIVIIMHGYRENAADFVDVTLSRMATRGLFVAAVSMRGRDGYSGTRDDSAREIHDIHDALQHIRATKVGIVHQTWAAIVGYSGGGGNALAAACKFPDAWAMVVSHFGMSDYGYDTTDGWHQNNGDPSTFQPILESSIGGTPAAVPNAYRARNAVEAIINYSGGHLYLYHDDADTSVPIVHSARIGAALLAASRTNYTENYTDSGDATRWLHALPNGSAPIINTEAIWAANAVAMTHSVWTIPSSGTVQVIGYIVTKRFTIWLRSNGSTVYGRDAVATVAYDTATDTYTVTPQTGAIDVTIAQGAKTGSATNISTATEIVVA